MRSDCYKITFHKYLEKCKNDFSLYLNLKTKYYDLRSSVRGSWWRYHSLAL